METRHASIQTWVVSLHRTHTMVRKHECSRESDSEINTDLLREHPSTGVEALRKKDAVTKRAASARFL